MLAKLEELLPTIFQYFGWGGGGGWWEDKSIMDKIM